MTQVKSRRGIVWVLVMIMLTFGVLLSVITTVSAFDPWYQNSWFELVGFNLCTIFLICMWIHSATENIIITENYLLVRSLLLSQRISWKEVAEIVVGPSFPGTILGGYSLWIKAPKRPYFQRIAVLSVSRYANSRQLSMAAVEAAFKASVSLMIVRLITDSYGYPPYGIFEMEKK